MTDQRPVFGGSERASGYVESAGPTQIPEVELAVPAEPESAGIVSEEATEPGNEATAERVRIDVPAVSRDLTGSWFTSAEDSGQELNAPTKATTGLRGLLAKTGLPIAPSAAELAAHEARVRLAAAQTLVRRTTWERPVGALFANRKGGAGKTPLAILLAGTIAWIRGGGVALLEVSDDPGMLALRAEGSPRLGLGDLMRDVHQVHSAGQLSAYTAPQTSHAAVIGSPRPRPNLTGEDVEAIAKLVDVHYGIRLMDSGNVYTSSAFTTAVKHSDALVIPVADAADAMQDALALVEYLGGSAHGRHLIENATVVRLRYIDAEPRIVQRVDEALDSMRVGRIVDVPADPHIASRGELSLAKLQPETRDALVHAAAAVIESLNQLDR